MEQKLLTVSIIFLFIKVDLSRSLVLSIFCPGYKYFHVCNFGTTSNVIGKRPQVFSRIERVRAHGDLGAPSVMFIQIAEILGDSGIL